MKYNSVKTGILASFIVFGGGYFLSQLIWKHIDSDYIHGIGLSHLFLFFLFGLCIAWTVLAVIKRKSKKLRLFWTSSGITNVFFITGSIFLLVNSINKGSDAGADIPSQSITILKDSTGGIVINQDGDTLIYRKDDSLLIDRTEQVDLKTMKLSDGDSLK